MRAQWPINESVNVKLYLMFGKKRKKGERSSSFTLFCFSFVYIVIFTFCLPRGHHEISLNNKANLLLEKFAFC